MPHLGNGIPLRVEKMLASTTMVPTAGYGCGDFSPDKSAFTYPKGRRKQTSLLLKVVLREFVVGYVACVLAIPAESLRNLHPRGRCERFQPTRHL